MTPAMRLAASLPVPPDLAACQRVAARAEALGYDSVWIADTGAGPDAFVVAAAAAQVTTSVRLGTAVIPVYTRTPSVMAAGAGSVAQLAPGRFVLGLGASSETIVERWGGVPFRRPSRAAPSARAASASFRRRPRRSRSTWPRSCRPCSSWPARSPTA
jgi:alkanesulfonate monooxygenase SsuD/methylene tetrahydromethanopterin reductase-like flavin-dependent oxidoreductase (luciferase family)